MYRGEVNVAHEQLSDLLKTAQVLKVKGLVEEHGSNTPNTPNTPNTHDLRPEETSVSPPPDISTSTSTGGGGASHSSPPSYYSLYGNSVSHDRGSSHLTSSLPSTWPLSLHSTGHQLPTSLSSVLGGSGGSYDNGIETSLFKRRKLPQPPSGLLINNDTPILRTVLGQAHVDSSQALPLLQPDSHEPVNYRNANSNGSMNDSDNRRNNDLIHGETTVHADVSYADEDERQSSPQSYPDTARNSGSNSNSNIAGVSYYASTNYLKLSALYYLQRVNELTNLLSPASYEQNSHGTTDNTQGKQSQPKGI